MQTCTYSERRVVVTAPHPARTEEFFYFYFLDKRKTHTQGPFCSYILHIHLYNLCLSWLCSPPTSDGLWRSVEMFQENRKN